MLIRAILHRAQKWHPKQASPERSGQWTGPSRSWLVSRYTVLLMANSSPPLQVCGSKDTVWQVRKYEGNEDGFDPRISNKQVWSCIPPLEGEPEPRISQRRDELNLGGPQSKRSSKQRRKQVPLSKGYDSALALPQVCRGWPCQTCRAGLLCRVPHGSCTRFGKDTCTCTEWELWWAPPDFKILSRAHHKGKDLLAILASWARR